MQTYLLIFIIQYWVEIGFVIKTHPTSSNQFSPYGMFAISITFIHGAPTFLLFLN